MKVCTNNGKKEDCDCLKRGCDGCYWYKEEKSKENKK